MNIRIPNGEAAQLLDVGSIALIIAAIGEIVAPATALLAFIWLALRIYKTWLEIRQLKNGNYHSRRKDDNEIS